MILFKILAILATLYAVALVASVTSPLLALSFLTGVAIRRTRR